MHAKPTLTWTTLSSYAHRVSIISLSDNHFTRMSEGHLAGGTMLHRHGLVYVGLSYTLAVREGGASAGSVL